MRSVVIGLAVMAGIAIAIGVYFYTNARDLSHGLLTAGDGALGMQVVAIQTNMQMAAAAAVCAVILVTAACVVHAIGWSKSAA